MVYGSLVSLVIVAFFEVGFDLLVTDCSSEVVVVGADKEEEEDREGKEDEGDAARGGGYEIGNVTAFADQHSC